MSYGEHNFTSQIALLSLLISWFDMGIALLIPDSLFLIFDQSFEQEPKKTPFLHADCTASAT
jgi:hypothetical protein